MKIVILAGGYGTRLSEETGRIPKPLVNIGDRPILWHIMKIYAAHGFDEFIICLGYKGYAIKEYFANYHLHHSDFTIDLATGAQDYYQTNAESWKVSLIDTGGDTLTGGRLKRIRKHVGDETFGMTYGDGVGNVDIQALLEFHRQHGKLATVTAVQQPARFGALDLKDNQVTQMREKSLGDGSWINSGFFMLEPAVLDMIDGDQTSWEREPMERLAKENQLMAFQHEGFWQPMDMLRDKQYLESLWNNGNAPWKIWKEQDSES